MLLAFLLLIFDFLIYMTKIAGTIFLSMVLMLKTFCTPVSSIAIVKNGVSDYSIVLPAEPTKVDNKAAQVLQEYILKVSGARLSIASENNFKGNHAIYVGKTALAQQLDIKGIQDDGFLLATAADNIVICGLHGQGTLYGAYTFLEDILGCQKFGNAPVAYETKKDILVDSKLHSLQNPSFKYRQSYYPSSNDPEYLAWHKLQKFEDLWGLWGHSFFKLVSPKDYFAQHPEYFSMVNGKRVPMQLCLSNEKVLEITINRLTQLMKENPDAEYWSISPNDDAGYCTCDLCKKADEEEDGPQGSLIRFVNKVADHFKDKSITTLAYGYSSHAPKHTKPVANVYILLSSIDAFRSKPLPEEPSAEGFRKMLKEWNSISPNLFIWDYTTQFTNYLAPFPYVDCLQPNLNYFKTNGVKGVFEQGSGDTYGDMAELNSFMQAKLLWSSGEDVTKLKQTFFKSYYGNGGAFIQQYQQDLTKALQQSGKNLDIYGNPINDYRGYLSPENIDGYSVLLDKAEAAIETNPTFLTRVQAARLGIEYTVLQQSRFFGADKFGYLQPDNAGGFTIKPNWAQRVSRFVAQCKKNGVTELSEGGISPDAYEKEWKGILAQGWKNNLAFNAKVTLANPFVEDYPAKKERTLVDGVTGYQDFSYNWLCFYGKDMIATIDLGAEKSINNVNMNFLDDPRHWIFQPASVTVEVSNDGIHYEKVGAKNFNTPEEHYTNTSQHCAFPLATTKHARYVRVSAQILTSLPGWRYHPTKKPMLCCDEIYVQ